MFLSCWLTSVRNLFSSRRLRGVRRPVRRWRQSDAQQQLEQLEARQVMAFDFVSATEGMELIERSRSAHTGPGEGQ